MLKSKRPKIGITGPDKGGKMAWIFTAISVYLSGGFPIRIRPKSLHSIDKLQGIILGGGADIHPDRYGATELIDQYINEAFHNKKSNLANKLGKYLNRLSYLFLFFIRRVYSRKYHKTDLQRDTLEFKILDQAINKKLPILGICRGAQLINVYFKGDLYPDIKGLYEEEVNHESLLPVKKVKIVNGSKLASILQTEELMVNALHHQAVKKPGKGIAIVATEPNGIVQGIESLIYDFVIGVQWHPEYLFRKEKHIILFKALVEKARSVRL